MYNIENTTVRIPARRSREYTTLLTLAQLRTRVAEALAAPKRTDIILDERGRPTGSVTQPVGRNMQ